ncbi:alpha/beta fold hydrolase [Pseudomonas cichorii]|uniref:alpha/beta fold hydrolase n=1 Tax=Pseudomonas cichorii TaxID=36746 RepID=UPI000EFE7610|nr:alpha/beta hydrolase [Pseudomonas cichorii]
MSFPGRSRHPALLISRLAAALGLTLLFTAAQASAASSAQAEQGVRNIVLVHGAFADGSSWSPVIARLQAKGYRVTAVQNPLTSLDDDVLATERVLSHQQGDVLLVGHSWAGAVISQAGNAANVKGLVYLSALVPDSGESVVDLLHRLDAPMDDLIADAHGLIWLDDPQAFHQVMAADLPMKKARELAAIQQPIAAASFAGKVRHAAWHDKPVWYLQTLDDQALKPSVQATIARQIGARVSAIHSSHMSLLSHPEQVSRLIEQAAHEAGQ